MNASAERIKKHRMNREKLVVVSVPNGKGGVINQQYRADQLPDNMELKDKYDMEKDGYTITKPDSWFSDNHKEASGNSDTALIQRVEQLEAQLAEALAAKPPAK